MMSGGKTLLAICTQFSWCKKNRYALALFRGVRCTWNSLQGTSQKLNSRAWRPDALLIYALYRQYREVQSDAKNARWVSLIEVIISLSDSGKHQWQLLICQHRIRGRFFPSRGMHTHIFNISAYYTESFASFPDFLYLLATRGMCPVYREG